MNTGRRLIEPERRAWCEFYFPPLNSCTAATIAAIFAGGVPAWML